MRALPRLLFLLLLSLLLVSSIFLASADKKSGVNVAEDILRRAESRRALPSVQVAAAHGVLRRLLPNHTSSFLFKVVDSGLCERYNCFRIGNFIKRSRYGPEIVIEGSTAVEVVSGLHWYLKYWCGAHISWDKTGGIQVASVPLPGSLPMVEDRKVKVERLVPWNYYQNVVTSSYSFAWWDSERWEKEIDWMALQGVNLPLAFTGQEAIWQKVFKDFNVRSKDLGNFFGGPAFLAWARMGNLHGWGGPLSQSWLDQQLNLQKFIVSRMIQLGMTPVLPAFSGNVPAIFQKIFPSANITRLSNWNTVDGDPRWCCTHLLDPSDPLFVEVGRSFIKQQIKEYGNVTNIYNCDTFNENLPPTKDPKYISSLGAAVYDAMTKGNIDAVWLMQGWLFSSDSTFWKPPQMKALLHSVPIGKMIVLDLFADVKPIWKTSSQFYGVPYVWCMLHNFGGNIEMYGILDSISSGPIDARVSQNSTMVGVGMCMEGIEQNPIVYELMSEMAFHTHKVKIQEWLESYSYRRYGQANSEIFSSQEWLESYSYRRYGLKATLMELLYDLVDLTKQVLAKLSNEVYLNIISAYHKNNTNELTSQIQKFLGLIEDIDLLLASDDNFLLGTWLESAKKLATNEKDERLFEWNARTQVTMWYDNTETNQSKLHDYANKYWSGLLKSYYLPRASTYFSYMLQSLRANQVFPLEKWRKDWISYSNKWQAGTESYPVKAEGDALLIAKALFAKYLVS